MSQHPRTLTEYRDAIEAHVKRWLPLLDLDTWRVSLELLDKDMEHVEEHAITVMSVESDWRYRWLHIRINPGAFDPEDRIHLDALEEHVVHELTHALLCELRGATKSTWRDREERVTTLISRAFIRTRDHTSDLEGEKLLKVIQAADKAIAGKPTAYQRMVKKLGAA